MLEKFLAVLTGLVAAIEANTEALKRPTVVVNPGPVVGGTPAVPEATPQKAADAKKPSGPSPEEAAAKLKAAKDKAEAEAKSPPPENPETSVGPIVYADVVAAVQASAKSVGRDATLEKLVGFVDASGKPLTEKKPDGTWTGSTRAAKPEDFAAIIGAVK